MSGLEKRSTYAGTRAFGSYPERRDMEAVRSKFERYTQNSLGG
jgi:hypothetical protein